MGLDVGLTESDKIEVVFEEVNNEDVTVELADNPVIVELDTTPEIQVAVNEVYSDVNVILDHNKLINRDLGKQHNASAIQETTAKRFTSDSEINSKVTKESGKGLSTNDFTNDYKNNGGVGTGVVNPSPISGRDLSTLNKLANEVDNLAEGLFTISINFVEPFPAVFFNGEPFKILSTSPDELLIAVNNNPYTLGGIIGAKDTVKVEGQIGYTILNCSI